MIIHLSGAAGSQPLRSHVTRYVCPYCTEGYWSDGERCHHCIGVGLTDDVGDIPGEELVRLPRPPAVMRAPCVDCAYRPGSPEDGKLRSDGEGLRPSDSTAPFFCHHGMHRTERDGHVGYVPAAECNGVPLGYMVCAGWWDSAVEGDARPERPFRDPGGSDRTSDAIE